MTFKMDWETSSMRHAKDVGVSASSFKALLYNDNLFQCNNVPRGLIRANFMRRDEDVKRWGGREKIILNVTFWFGFKVQIFFFSFS